MKKTTFAMTVLGTVILIAAVGFVKSVMQQPKAPQKTEMGQNCLECHRFPNTNTNEGVVAARDFCTQCHTDAEKATRKYAVRAERKQDGTDVSIELAPTHLDKWPHDRVACIRCHTDVAGTPHRTVSGASCDACHTPHGEATAHDPHLRVACQSCHGNYKAVHLDTSDDRVKPARIDAQGTPLAITDHSLIDAEDKTACERCHFKANPVGAPAAVLPSKSAMCILCHNAPLAIGHPIFGVALLILLLGVLLTLRFWFLGSVKDEKESLHRKIDLASESVYGTIFSRKIFTLLKIFILDIVFQRRILQESVQRWFMHALIFSALLARFALSMFTAIIHKLAPGSSWAMALIDKNNGFTAFANDLLGLLILCGILWAVIQRYFLKPTHVVAEIEDNITVALVGLLVAFGFVLEGARILATQVPPEVAGYAFIGYPLSRLFAIAGWDWTAIYPSLWYVHAMLGAAFVAYLPFGKLRHVFNTPLTYFVEAIAGVKRGERV